MTKTQLIERYRNCYATDAHLDTGVELGILTTDRGGDGIIHLTLDVAQECIQKRGEGGIVPAETLQQVEAILKGEME